MNYLFPIICAFIFSLSRIIMPSPAVAAFDINLGSDLLPVDEGKRISMDFTDAQLNDVLKIFSQQSGLNFIAATDVSAITVNLYLDQVPVEEALERILSANNLTYEIKPGSNIFVVKRLDRPAKDLITRVYSLRFATVPSSKLNSTINFSSSDSSGSSGGAPTAGSASNGMTEAIKQLLSPDGSLVEDARTNSIIITDIAAQFPIIEQTIARLDIKIPQILIEVEMLDISKTTADLMGAKFGDTLVSMAGAQQGTLWPFNQDNIIDKNRFAFGGEDGEPEYTAGSISFQNFTLALQFLKTQSDTKNLARPRLLTLNNETAKIQIKTDEAIGRAQSTSSSEGTSSSVAAAERVETGVFLTVTPQANLQTSEITLALEPKVIQARTGGTFEGYTFKDPEERGTKSILRVPDGDTVIIGGLLRTDTTDTRTNVPGLSNVPLLGAAFRHKNISESQRELIIFITPHILRETNQSSLDERDAPEEDAPLMREQEIPAARLKTINRELSHVEKRRR